MTNQYKGIKDPLTDPNVLADIVKRGYLDAVHIVKGGKFRGTLHTRIINGACEAIDEKTGEILSEKNRLERLAKK